MSYSSTVLADTPTAFWEFDEGSSSPTAADSSGNSLTGTYTRTITTGALPLINAGHSTAFNGGWATVSSSTHIQPGTGGAMSFEAWVLTTNTAIQTVIGCDNSSGAGRLFQFRLDATGHINTIIFNATGASNVSATSTGTVNNGGVHHIVATYDGTNIRSYIDGVASGVTACTLVGSTGAHALNLGQGLTGTGSPFAGYIDEVAFYTYTLSATQVSTHFSAGVRSTTNAVMSQEALEVLERGAASARASQVAVEVLRQSSPPASAGLSQLAVEVLVQVVPYMVDIEMV